MAQDADGNILEVGDVVGFKCDIEQSGRITKILNGRDLLLEPLTDHGYFQGDYIGRDDTTVQPANRCFKERCW